MKTSDFKYFTLLDIPVSFKPDISLLKKNYYRLSRDLHPDFFTNESSEVKMQKLLESGELNMAYKILINQSDRTKYILESYGLMNDIDNATLSKDFLNEMMDINEAIFELQMQYHHEQYESLLHEIGEKQALLESKLSTCFDNFDKDSDKEQVLAEILDIYLKSKYLLRIHKNISTFAAPSEEGT